MSPHEEPQPAFPDDDSVPKHCKRCDKTKTRGDFARHNTTRDGRQGACRQCHAEMLVSHRKRRRDAGLPSYTQIERRKIRLEVLTHYSGQAPRCGCCGEDTLEFLAVDHIEGGGARHRKTIPSGDIYRFLRRNGFPEGFRVLCHNCNQARGSYGYCPHERRGRPEPG